MTYYIERTPALMTGARIRELRDRTGTSRKRLALSSDTNITHLARIERGTANPSLGTLARIADALDTSVADLVRDVRS
ncbi:helix-turn-helix domain-containing protein [Leucobacter denitrificans]|uniref:Helix-turn-helix domain-containing protein n=1 Tax=Leucobacter denitrificans TaxID=683042 RepID=A0A7G9S2F4_9MICO|nr:helix-turn-helix domain-containing protein [Leucobacter denitrificans]QNN62029.1 helix-turn-helix domain-containing protein [Leucobacter denitrificans]